jgi:Fe-S cluster assembly protein SufD
MNPGLSTSDCATYSVLFAQTGAARAGEPAWLRQTRQNAFETFVTLGWPTTKEEAWRFTDPGRITPGLLPLAETHAASGTPTFEEMLREVGRGTGHRLRFVDGRHAGERPGDWPAPPGLALAPLATAIPDPAANLDAVLGQALRQPSALVALNTAFMRDGAVVRIPPGLVVEAPIFLVYLAAAPERASFPRTVVHCGANSQATLVELHLGADHRATLANAVTEILLEPGARLGYYAIQRPSPAGGHVGHLGVVQRAGSTLRAHSLTLGGRLVRNDAHVELAEPGCSCQLDGLYLAGSGSHLDNQTSIDHRAPRCTSRESYRGVVARNGQAVWSGRAVVRPGAQGTDARQANRNLLLADDAIVHAKPHLEIFASDVKCSHGATSGHLDAEALFYLRSRGIAEREAHQLLVAAFLREGLGAVTLPSLHGELEAVLASRARELLGEEEAAA